MAFARATAVKRRVHISDAFMVTNLRAAEFLGDALSAADSCWTLSEEDALRAYVGPDVPQRQQRQREVIAFMTQAEIGADDLPFVKNRFTLQAATQSDFVCKLDPGRCLTGVCSEF